MPDPTNDIDALLRYLDYLVGGDPQWAHAVRALVAERNALKQRVSKLEARAKPVYITDGQRVESIDLRERLVCAALTGLMAQPAHGSRESWANIAVSFADATLAAIRKGASDAK